MKPIPKNLDEKSVTEALYKGLDITKISIANDLIEEYNESKVELENPDIIDDPEFTFEWMMPDEYKELDLDKFLIDKCKNDLEIQRVTEELELFRMSGNIELVKYCIYLVDMFKSKNLVHGVGRGSSVSIFIFYLIGLHKVNSIKYELDYSDFFKLKELQ
jgi:DNA polymerase III alpha subunit